MTMNSWGIASLLISIAFGIYAAYFDTSGDLFNSIAWAVSGVLLILSIVFFVLRKKAPVVTE